MAGRLREPLPTPPTPLKAPARTRHGLDLTSPQARHEDAHLPLADLALLADLADDPALLTDVLVILDAVDGEIDVVEAVIGHLADRSP